MDRAKQDSVRRLPIKTCLACGGTWFRQVVVDWPRPPGQQDAAGGIPIRMIVHMPMTVLVCLCGTPFRPPIGGIRGGHTPNAEINHFFRSFESAERLNGFRKD